MRFAPREKILASLMIGGVVAGGVHWLRWYQSYTAGYAFNQTIVGALLCCGSVMAVMFIIVVRTSLALRWVVTTIIGLSLTLNWLAPLPVPQYIQRFESRRPELTVLAQQVAALRPSVSGNLPCLPVPSGLQPVFFEQSRARVCQTRFDRSAGVWPAVTFWLLDGFEFFYMPLPTPDKQRFCVSGPFVEIDEHWFACGRSLPRGIIGA